MKYIIINIIIKNKKRMNKERMNKESFKSKVDKINQIPVGELFTDSEEEVEKLNKIQVSKLIENFEGGVQKSRLKLVFVVLVLLALWLIIFY
jgi:hypothetical protein